MRISGCFQSLLTFITENTQEISQSKLERTSVWENSQIFGIHRIPWHNMNTEKSKNIKRSDFTGTLTSNDGYWNPGKLDLFFVQWTSIELRRRNKYIELIDSEEPDPISYNSKKTFHRNIHNFVCAVYY